MARRGKRRFGSVRKLPSGRWQVRYWANDEGERLLAPHTFLTRRDAEQFLAAKETDRLRGVDRDLSPEPEVQLSFAEWIEIYGESIKHKRPTTAARDTNVINVHLVPQFGERKLADITPLMIQRFVNAMAVKLAPATVRTNYAVLRAVLNAAVAAEALDRSPCRGIRLPPEQRARKIRFLDVGELTGLAKATPLPYRPMIYLAGVLGLRWSEVAGLRARHLDLRHRLLTIDETLAEVEGQILTADVKSKASRRTLELPQLLADTLKDHVARQKLVGDDLLFTASDGSPLRASNFRNRIWAPALRAAGLDGEGLTFHHLRHTAVGFLIDANTPAAVMQRRMGHASIRTTLDVYGHVLPATDRATTDRLNQLLTDALGTDWARPDDAPDLP